MITLFERKAANQGALFEGGGQETEKYLNRIHHALRVGLLNTRIIRMGSPNKEIFPQNNQIRTKIGISKAK